MFSLAFQRLRPLVTSGGVFYRLNYARGISELPAGIPKKRLMNDFTRFLNGRGNREAAFQLLKGCANGMRADLPKNRVLLADQVYSSMQAKGLLFNTQLYNSLLQVYLANRHPFSPADFLSNMREEGAVPNRGTLTLLLEGYCQQGNMTGAKQILSELKARDMTINEEVYAALISGHAHAGDMESAKQIVSIMKEGEIQPGLKSYTALLSGYAYHGDLESIKNLISTMKEEQLFVSYSVFTEVIDALSGGGHPGKIPEVLDMIRNKEWMYHELVHKAEDLSARGEGESSLHILNCLEGLNSFGEGENHFDKACSAVVRNMIKTDSPFDFVLSTASSLAVVEGVSSQSMYQELLKAIFTEERWEDGRTMLLEMKKRGLTIKPHFLYPPMTFYAKDQAIKEYFQWYDVFTNDLQFSPDKRIMELTFTALKKQKKGITQFLKEQNISVTESTVKLITLMYCRNHLYDSLYETLSNVDQSIIPASYVLETIAFHYKPRTTTPETIEKIFLLLAPISGSNRANKSLHTIITKMVESSTGRNAYLFMKSLLSQGGLEHPRSNTCNFVLVSLNDKEFINDFFDFLQLMKRHNVPIDNHHRRQILKMSAKTGAAFIAQNAFKQMKEDGAVDASIYSNLIIALCKGKKYHLALKHYEEIRDNPKYQLSLMAYSCLVQGYILHRDFNSANEIRSLLDERGIKPGLSIHNSFMEGFLNKGDMQGVQTQFEQLVADGLVPNSFSYHKLMQSYAHHKDLDNVHKVLLDAKRSGCDISKKMVETLIETCLSVGDLPASLEYLDHYSSIPPSMKTFMGVIEASVTQDHPDITRQAVDILKTTGASADVVNHTLMFSLIKCGRLDEAMALARKEGLKINLDLVNELGKSCQSSGNVDCLLSLMGLLREFGIKPYMLHVPLIKAYAANNSVEPLLSIAKELQSQGETPRYSFHATLSMLLKQLNKEAPYVYTGRTEPPTSATASVAAN